MTAETFHEPGKSYAALVRTFNSERTLNKTLRALRIQSAPPSEIIVVDSGSTDGTLAIAEKFGAKVVRYPAGMKFNYSKSLNLGMEAATRELVLIISSHTVIPYRETMARMVASVQGDERAGAYCATIALMDHPQGGARRKPGGVSVVEISEANFDGSNGLWNTCALIKKKFWTAHRFEEVVWAAEDQEWAGWQFRNGGRKIARLENSGALDLNTKRSKWKFARDYVAVARYSMPEYYRWGAILRRYVSCARALARMNRTRFKEEFLQATLLALHRLGWMRFESEYYAGPPAWLAWCVR